jgi:hypothetical protein
MLLSELEMNTLSLDASFFLRELDANEIPPKAQAVVEKRSITPRFLYASLVISVATDLICGRLDMDRANSSTQRPQGEQ